MKYHQWKKPRNFQADDDFQGPAFVESFRLSDRLDHLLTLIHLSRTKWELRLGESHGNWTMLDVSNTVSIGKHNVVFRVRFSDDKVWIA